MTLQFLGATEQVTGSKYLLEVEGLRILIDCGFDLEARHQDEFQHPFNFNPKTLDVVLLTHAHIDHSGLIPLLVKEGFTGTVYCTYATYQLSRLLLFDAARINLKRARKKKTPDFYGPREVEESLDYFRPIDFEQPYSLSDSFSFYFRQAGHLLGAAHIVVQAEDKTVVFSGDIGRPTYPLLPDPEPIPAADYIISETTYGARVHEHRNPEKIIADTIYKACVEIPGRLIIPSFSVGRTQTLLFLLNKLRVAGKLPSIKIFTDSPLARKSTQVYQDFVDFMNREAREFNDRHGALFDFDNLIYINDMNSAEEIDRYNEPCIIITSSGMVKGGKSEDHITRNLENSYCSILFIGYCAEGTLGRKLLAGLSTFRKFGEEIKVNAQILSTDVLSGHGDYDNLLSFFKTQDKHRLKKVFLVHGDKDAMENFKGSLEHHGFEHVVMPKRGQKFELAEALTYQSKLK
ncbi:MAG: MBL fold metallo-hydrolase [Bacteroidota bacterium]